MSYPAACSKAGPQFDVAGVHVGVMLPCSACSRTLDDEQCGSHVTVEYEPQNLVWQTIVKLTVPISGEATAGS
jgi:hypothetical protein